MIGTRIDGAILNLCHARGMETEPAAEFLMNVARIHLPLDKSILIRRQMQVGRDRGEMPDYRNLDENNPLFQKARERIVRMEKAVANVQNGNGSDINRKKWRKDKGDSQTIVDTMFHVISRKPPQTQEDRLKDAFSYLMRTGEIGCANGLPRIIETYEGKPGLNVTSQNRSMIIGESSVGNIKIYGRDHGAMDIRINGEFPESTWIKIKELEAQGGLVNDIISWDALIGPMPAVLERADRSEGYQNFSGEQVGAQLIIRARTGWIEKDVDSKKINVHPPKRYSY